MGRTEREILVAEANMPIEDLMAKYSAVEPPPLHQLKKLQKDKHQSPMIRAKKPPLSGMYPSAPSFHYLWECFRILQIPGNT